MLAIKNNLMAENAARHLGKSYEALSRSVERLSSGLRINTAKDDAAGMAVSELLKADIATSKQGARNARDGISMLQNAEGAMGNIDELLVRMKELAEQAATDSYSAPQRSIMNNEFGELADEITRVAQSTTFNSIALLNPLVDNTQYNIHIGSSTTINIVASKMTRDSATLGLGSTGSKASYTNVNGVADAGAGFATQDGAGASTVTFDFGTEAGFSITMAKGANYSLNQIATMINTASNDSGRAAADRYSAASVVYNNTTNMWHLKLTANTAGDNKDLVISQVGGDMATVFDAVATDFTGGDGTNAAGGSADISTKANAVLALASLTTAIENKDTYRAKLGYWMNRLESAAAVLDIQSENLQAANSRIADVDTATETAAMTRNQVLAQAGISMLSQANTMPQMALKLLG